MSVRKPSHPLIKLSATDLITEAIRDRPQERQVLLGLDGRSGSGKSHIAALLAGRLGAVVVPADDFFAAEISDAGWDARNNAERARDCLDWARLRRDALEPLLDGVDARWYAFDFERGTESDGSYRFKTEPEVRQPRRVVILEGAYCTRPELSDLIDLAVLVEAPATTRRERQAAREDPTFLAEWYERWQGAEDHYFAQVRPPSSFDLIVENP